jgi:hypothetical protein
LSLVPGLGTRTRGQAGGNAAARARDVVSICASVNGPDALSRLANALRYSSRCERISVAPRRPSIGRSALVKQKTPWIGHELAASPSACSTAVTWRSRPSTSFVRSRPSINSLDLPKSGVETLTLPVQSLASMTKMPFGGDGEVIDVAAPARHPAIVQQDRRTVGGPGLEGLGYGGLAMGSSQPGRLMLRLAA